MPRKKRKANPSIPKFIPCGRCLGGLVRVKKGSGYVMRNCECMNAWKGIKSAAIVDGKAKGAGSD